MSDLKVTDIYVYPIKSLAGIRLESAELSETGIQFDRYWMLVKTDGSFITQREIPQLILFQLELKADYLKVIFGDKTLTIPKTLTQLDEIECEIFGDKVLGYKESNEINDWFSTILEQAVFLVRKTDHAKRPVKNHEDSYINFSDASQYLIIGQESLKQLNTKLEEPVPMNRFRANIIFESGTAHIEDTWGEIRIGKATFQSVKPCGRCKMTTINQRTGIVGKEPLQTLATYRKTGNKILFGQYLKLLDSAEETLRVGDEILPL